MTDHVEAILAKRPVTVDFDSSDGCLMERYADELEALVRRLATALETIANANPAVTDDYGRDIPGRVSIHPGLRYIAAAALGSPETTEEAPRDHA